MLQQMLTERIGLVIRRETQDVHVYDLVVAKGGIRMKESGPAAPDPTPVVAPADSPGGRGGRPGLSFVTDKNGRPELAPGRAGRTPIPMGGGHTRISAWMQTAADIRSMMEARVGHPVSDRPGLTGTYDFNLDFGMEMADSSGDASDPFPTFDAAIEPQLGLKLLSKKGPVEIIIVEHFEKAPVGN